MVLFHKVCLQAQNKEMTSHDDLRHEKIKKKKNLFCCTRFRQGCKTAYIWTKSIWASSTQTVNVYCINTNCKEVKFLFMYMKLHLKWSLYEFHVDLIVAKSSSWNHINFGKLYWSSFMITYICQWDPGQSCRGIRHQECTSSRTCLS